MLPRLGQSKLVDNWIIVTILCSVIGWLDGRFAAWAALIPSRILHGELWRLFTWPFAEPGPMSLILTCASIYKFGGELAVRWGDRRLKRFATEVVLGATVFTVLLALVTGQRYVVKLGGWAVTDALVIAWARQFPTACLTVYGMLTLSGQRLINVTVGASILFAIAYGPVWMGPELAACAIAALYPAKLLRR